jgi:predicted RNA-binding Zn-ribbon protein involved in translation (DUF1610 family)
VTDAVRDHTEQCAACGWSLSIIHGRPSATYHPPACPRCGSREWTAFDAHAVTPHIKRAG